MHERISYGLGYDFIRCLPVVDVRVGGLPPAVLAGVRAVSGDGLLSVVEAGFGGHPSAVVESSGLSPRGCYDVVWLFCPLFVVGCIDW